MPRGDKSKYTDKQERKADHIAEGYEKRGVSDKEAERRAWATVKAIRLHTRAAGLAARHRRRAHLQADRSRPRRPQPPANGTLNTARINWVLGVQR